MTILEQMKRFADRFGKTLILQNTTWRYYRLGTGAPVLWLTGGSRRAAFGFDFLERLAARHTVIAPDYPPVRTGAEYVAAFDAILRAEGVDTCALAGQSYGGLLAQLYLARRPEVVERLILSSTGPADYGRAWLPVEYAVTTMLRLLPEKTVMGLLARGLPRIFRVPEGEREQWREAVAEVVRHDLSRADVISHFAVAADIIREGLVTPAAYRRWSGRVIVLSAADDPTQSRKDIPRYERLFGRPVEVIQMGNMGHTAALFDTSRYVDLFEQALA